MAFAVKDYSETTYVTGMRAYAALAVVFIHAGGAGFRSFGNLGNLFVDMGRGGVYAFFVISGFSVAASYRQAGSYWRYLFLRYFRLAPLYYFWLLVFALVFQRTGYWGLTLGTIPWIPDLALHLTFLHAFLLPTANSIIGVEWSLSVEMFWYFLLPLMVIAVERGKGGAMFMVAVAAYSLPYLLFSRVQRLDARFIYALEWHPFSYALSFSVGAWAHGLRPQAPRRYRSLAIKAAFVALAAYWVASAWTGNVIGELMLPVSFVTFVLLVFGSKDEPWCQALFMPRVVLQLGTLSYGIYLCHRLPIDLLDRFGSFGPWVEALRFLFVAAVSTALAYGSYRWIELPAQRWSKRFWPLVNKS